MSFDVAHRMYAEYIDGLEVWGKPGGESEWTVLWSAYGADLSVPDCYTWFWYDTNGEVVWATHEVVFPASWQEGVTCLELAFVNVGGYGNHTWIDQVSVGNPVGISEHERAQWRLFPNPNEGPFTTMVPVEFVGSAYALTDQVGRVVQQGTIKTSTEAWLLPASPGWYVLEIQGLAPKKIIIH